MSGTASEKPPSLFTRRRVRILYLAAVTLAILALAYTLSEALNPFLLALLIAYILNPAVQFLERRARLPRTLAILLIYAAGAGVIAAGATYSVGKTMGGVDKVMTKVVGGWQIVPKVPRAPAAAPGGPGGEAERPEGRPKRLPNLPVYGDEAIAENPQSPALGWIDVNGNGTREGTEPEFTRDSGRWLPTPEFASIVRRVPGYFDDMRERLASLLPHIDRRQVEEIANKAEAGATALAAAGAAVWHWMTERFVGGILTVVMYCVLVPVYTFFLLRGFDTIVARAKTLLPGLYRERIESILTRIDRSCAAFFRGRFFICVGKGLLIWFGLWLVGVDLALPIGVLAGALSIIPAVGPIVGMALAVVFSYAPDGAWLGRIVGAGIVFAAAETAEAVANPVILGREVGLHPVTLLLALFMFGELFGFFGVLLAVPLAAIAKILGQEFVLPEFQHLAAERPGSPVSGFLPVYRPPEPVETEPK